MRTTFAKSEPDERGDEENFRAGQFATVTGEGDQGNRALVDALASSRIYRDYERAFTDITGSMPGSWRQTVEGKTP